MPILGSGTAFTAQKHFLTLIDRLCHWSTVAPTTDRPTAQHDPSIAQISRSRARYTLNKKAYS